MKISNLKANPKNPRIIKDDKFKKLVKSLQDFPEMMEKRPMVCVTDVDGKLFPLGGNMRLKALQELKHKEIPDEWVMLADEWTEDKRQEFVIKDNVGFGEWDWDELNADWDIQQLEEWGLDMPEGCEEEELEAVEDDYEIPDTIETDIVLGDLFEIGEHRLLCGDSTDSDSVAKLMNGEKADMVFTDPPYGVSYEGGHNKKKRKGIENDTLQNENLTDLFYDSLLNAEVFTKDYAAFYIWYSNSKAVETFKSFDKLNLEIRNVLIWYKIKSGFAAFMAQYIQNYEPVIYAFKKGKVPQWFGSSTEKTVWELKKDNINEYHPTQKPVELPEKALINSSKQSDIILDLFLGSGSTMVAAHQLKRKCYGMELDPKYCQVIVDRMKKLDPDIVIKKNGKIME